MSPTHRQAMNFLKRTLILVQFKFKIRQTKIVLKETPRVSVITGLDYWTLNFNAIFMFSTSIFYLSNYTINCNNLQG